ncbi:AAA family ATPase [Gordonia crocea]|uniref:Endonuclease GajA/Old nuclease/RecF-like AAA domain-containing protein n=1 Tax=Gordonia crocea TaxID=589162 RepID=A0A7I9UWV8_9ACTN|nr:AAA family ATPase [Gordonia crocea]GED97423.1 hypothetical protein nbrc107697_14620 [Gordonia crocea]
MKLHRLRLRNFRGIADRECVFADRGVTVVSGRNEAGKSSMVEALDLLLDVPSASKSRRVAAVQPAGCDVGTEVEAEISCGPWHFTYTKVFNRGQSTTLRIHEPKPEQLTGKPAHERATQILAEAVDLALLRASRVVQGSAATTVAVSASASITRALDRAVADADAEADDDPDDGLLGAVAREYGRYYTVGRGQPTGELLAARQREEAARAELAKLEAALAAVDEDEQTVARLTRRRQQLGSAAEQWQVELEEFEAARKAADEVRDRLATQTAKAEAAGLRRAACAREIQTRRRTDAKLAELGADRDAARDQVREAVAAVERVGAQEQAVEEDRTAAEAAWTAARERVKEGEGAARALDRHRELDSATRRLALVREACDRLAAQERELAANTVDGGVLARARKLREELVGIEARLGAAGTALRVVGLGDQAVLVDGEAITGGRETVVVDDLVVEVPGVVRVELRAGSDTAALGARRGELVGLAAELCTAHGVADLGALIALGEERQAIEPRVAAARADADRVCAGETVESLGELVSQLAEQIGDTEQPATPDLAALRAAERECAAAHLDAERESLAQSGRRADATATLQRAHEAIARIERDLAELTAARDEARRDKSDAELAAEHDRAERDVAEIEEVARGLRDKLDAADMAELERRVEQLDTAIADLAQERERGEREIAQALARIELCREDARRDRRDEAAGAHRGAAADLERVTARARAAQVLHEVLHRHRSAAHARYSEPFRRRIEDLAEPLFGPSVRFEVDEQLGITARTLDGATVPFDELSMGAREQIGIISRLACAMLVDEAQGVPVIIDDALGHSDSDRVAQMARVLTRAGEHAQVIVLTCAPERYRGVATASTVEV